MKGTENYVDPTTKERVDLSADYKGACRTPAGADRWPLGAHCAAACRVTWASIFMLRSHMSTPFKPRIKCYLSGPFATAAVAWMPDCITRGSGLIGSIRRNGRN